MSSHSSRSLTTVPREMHYRLLTALPSFPDPAATVLAACLLHSAFDAHRRKVVSAVGRNFLGGIFTDALPLARFREKREDSDALKVKGLSAGTVRLLVKNGDVVGELQGIVFGLMKDPNVVECVLYFVWGDVEIYDVCSGSIHSRPSLSKFAKAPPVVPIRDRIRRFKSAAYRFYVYCLLNTSDARTPNTGTLCRHKAVT
ncbi:hypothetical protein B0H13DRAFT_1916068 [Mycena leptocephala]|nr:hypothetical protein B0H13DRAFT_1916068 [Mycena leptocephala]